MQFLSLVACTVPFVVALDLLWLGVIAKDFYRAQLGDLISPTVVWPAAIFFYVIYAVGIVFFVVNPALAAQSLLRAVLVGALFGFIGYCVYDLTNLATLKNWPLVMTLVDIVWGAFLTAVAAGGAYLLAIKVFGM